MPTEPEFLAAVQSAVNALVPRYSFGAWHNDDLAGDIRLWAVEALPRYDAARGPLDAFIFSHCRNRCLNLRRDQLSRSDSPCQACHRGESCGPGGPCEAHRTWEDRQRRKRYVYMPLPLSALGGRGAVTERVDLGADRAYREAQEGLRAADLQEALDELVPADVRPAMLQMLQGRPVTRAAKRRVREAVAEALRRLEGA